MTARLATTDRALRLGRLAGVAGFGLVLASGSAATGAAPADNRPTLVGSFLQLCANGPADPNRILAVASRQGWTPVAADETPMVRAGFVQAAVWSKADGARGRIFLILGHGDSPYLSTTAVADVCQVTGQIRGVSGALTALTTWAGSLAACSACNL